MYKSIVLCWIRICVFLPRTSSKGHLIHVLSRNFVQSGTAILICHIWIQGPLQDVLHVLDAILVRCVNELLVEAILWWTQR